MSSIVDDIKYSFKRGDVLMQIIGINVIIYLVILFSWLICLLFKLPDPVDYVLVNYLITISNFSNSERTPGTEKTAFFILFLSGSIVKLNAARYHLLDRMLKK